MSGVSEYSRAIVDIYFAKGEERCQYCPMLQTYARNQCNRTGEYIIDIRGRGMYCPLKFTERTEYGEI